MFPHQRVALVSTLTHTPYENQVKLNDRSTNPPDFTLLSRFSALLDAEMPKDQKSKDNAPTKRGEASLTAGRVSKNDTFSKASKNISSGPMLAVAPNKQMEVETGPQKSKKQQRAEKKQAKKEMMKKEKPEGEQS
jgi:ribosomal 50S subunit-recycling heat shock protein